MTDSPRPLPLWRRLLTLLLALLMATPTAAQVRLPALGEGASADLSISAERRVGDQVMREGRRDPAYLDDPVLLDYLNRLWLPLVQAARDKGDIEPEVDRAFVWEAFLVRDRSVNAFAMPGGYVGVHLGLIALTNTADQLASVLAHELSHITQRHIARSIAPQQRASLLAIAGLLLAVAAAGRSSGDTANAALATGQAAAIQSQLNFSRDMEREADRIGFALMARAGFSPGGMAAMFERMDQATRLNDSGGFPYLRSHPLTLDRVAESRNRVLMLGAPAPGTTLLHALMQMRARILMDDGVQSLQRMNGETSSSALSDRVAALYGGALAASMLREHGKARTQAQEALTLAQGASPREPEAETALRGLQVQLALARGEPDQALELLQTIDGATAHPQRVALLLRAQALAMQNARMQGNPEAKAHAELAPALKASTETLQTWLADKPTDALAWEALAQTSQLLNMHLRSLRAQAEARAALGDLTGAIDRLRVAQQASRGASGPDLIEASVIDTRLRQLQARRRDIALEAREAREGSNRRAPDGPQ